jgi:hypothetical protein
VFGRDRHREVVKVALDQLAEREHDADAPGK